jgi:hypothetical protein
LLEKRNHLILRALIRALTLILVVFSSDYGVSVQCTFISGEILWFRTPRRDEQAARCHHRHESFSKTQFSALLVVAKLNTFSSISMLTKM